MELMIVAVGGRILERLIVAAGGALSLYLGYRLFFIVTNDVLKTEMSGKGFKFKAERLGPGIFFAFFGAAILIYSIISPVSVSRDIYAGTPAPSPPSRSADQESNGKVEYKGALGPTIEPLQAKSQLMALRMLERFAEATVDANQKAKLQMSQIGTKAIEKELVDNAFGDGRYAEWRKLTDIRTIDPKAFASQITADANLKQRYEEVDNAMSQEL